MKVTQSLLLIVDIVKPSKPWLQISRKGSRCRSGESCLFREITELEEEEGPMLSLHYH